MSQKKNIGIYANSLQKKRKTTAHELYNILHSRGHNLFIFDVDNELSKQQLVAREYRHADIEFGPYTPQQVEEKFPRTQVDSLDAVLFRRDPPNNAKDIDFMVSAYPDAQYINSPEIIKRMDKSYTKKIAALDESFVPHTYFSNNAQQVIEYVHTLTDAILKPLNDLGGNGIQKVSSDTDNLEEIVSDMTKGNTEIVIQEFLPEISQGDKRVIYLDGEVMGQYSRMPPKGGYLANLQQNGTIQQAKLTDTEKHIIKTITPTLRADGIYFAGLDFIGNKLTEVNVQNPGFTELVNNGQVHMLATELEGLLHVQPETTPAYTFLGMKLPQQPTLQYGT